MSAPSPGERRLRAAALVALAVAAVVLVTHWAPRAVDPSAVPDPCALVDCGADAAPSRSSSSADAAGVADVGAPPDAAPSQSASIQPGRDRGGSCPSR